MPLSSPASQPDLSVCMLFKGLFFLARSMRLLPPHPMCVSSCESFFACLVLEARLCFGESFFARLVLETKCVFVRGFLLVLYLRPSW